ncbi:MAG: AEC family transporter [Panacagrimonas sp.]
MSAFLLLIACPALGWVFARRQWMPAGAAVAINAWVMRIALPALVLEQVPRLNWEPALLFAAATPWIVVLGAAVFIPMVGRRLGWDRASIGALVLTCGLGNTAFIGLPMIQALAGPQALGAALIADQLGSFIALSTAGVLLASIYAGDRIELREVAQRLLRFPPFLALPVALVVRELGGWPEPVAVVLHRLGDTITPLALFSVGLVFQFGALSGRTRFLAAGLAWKLVLAPLIALLVGLVCGVGGTPLMAGVLQAAQGPMITAGILAQEHRLDPELVTLVVGFGILMSFVTAPLWFLLMHVGGA